MYFLHNYPILVVGVRRAMARRNSELVERPGIEPVPNLKKSLIYKAFLGIVPKKSPKIFKVLQLCNVDLDF